MGRPKSVNIKTFHLYDKLHTSLTKMMSGVYGITLYPIKETKEFFTSPEVWAYCASKFRMKKKNVTLEVNIPTITDEKTITFLENKAWKDWVAKELERNSSNMKETIKLLKKIFPDKELIYFFELDNLLSQYYNGIFISYNEDGSIREPSENRIERQKEINCYHSESRFMIHHPMIKPLYEKYKNESDEVKKKEYFKLYSSAERNYIFENENNIDVFIEIGKNAVCYPVAFTENTAEWSKEKYGKLVGYAHAGEIFFVVTPKTVYFEIKRHF